MAQNCSAKEYRESLHAGTWYPEKAKELRGMIEKFLDNARSKDYGEIYGLVSPHAGYVYSGPVAAFGYKAIADKEFDNVIIIGPSHQHSFFGASVDKSAGRETPLGVVEYDLAMAEKIMKQNKNIIYDSEAHSMEHSVEIEVPFLQVVLKKIKTVEIIMGSQDHETCTMLADAIVKAAKGKRVLVVASSDLSHYHSQTDAERLDGFVIEAVEKFDPELLFKRLASDSCEACGGGPIIVCMLAAKKLGANASKVLKYATSGDVTGDYAQVVGYLSAVFYGGTEEDEVGVDLGLSETEKKKLKEIAWKALEAGVKGEEIPAVEDIPENLNAQYGVFVTITKHGDLRGCIGHIIGDQPLYQACQQMAQAAALQDPRFSPVTEKELSSLEIEISVLTPLEKVEDLKEIVIGRDGLLIRKGYASGLLLPQVATDYGWTIEEFLENTCEKAGLPADAYKSSDAEIYKFSAQIF